MSEWNQPIWEHDLDTGLPMLRLAVDTHLITSHYAHPLLTGRGARRARLYGGRADTGLDALGDDAGELRGHRAELARGDQGEPHFTAISESPRFVGRAAAALAADSDLARRNGGSFSSGEAARAYGFTDVDGSRPDCWRYLVEVQEAGKPPDPNRLPLKRSRGTRTLGPAING
jgi:hypothetical protein